MEVVLSGLELIRVDAALISRTPNTPGLAV